MTVVAAALLCGTAPASPEVLSGREFQNLLASGPEGTTILFEGGTDRLFYSPTLKNKLRQSPELGSGFLKQKIIQNTLSEGTFVSSALEGGKLRTISGIAGIAADTDSGHGILTLVQTYADDTSIKAFETRDRFYAVVIVEDSANGILCRKSRWEKLFASKDAPKMTTVRCEFVVGNAVTPAAAQ
jgi:hypothetical protein